MQNIERHLVDELPANCERAYVVYKSPMDHPGKLVVREQAVVGASLQISRKPHIVADTIDQARHTIPSWTNCDAK